MVALLVVMVPAAALGTPTQQQFQNYQNPILGVSIQYPSDWELLEKSNDKLTFTKQEGFVGADLNVEEIDQSDATLPEYANTRINELKTQRPDFQLVSLEPIIISNDIPAQKVVYTFEREEDGKTNKVMRIWSINEGKLYTLAYIAESSQYDRYLPAFQRMVDSFVIDNTFSTTQVKSGEDNNRGGNCDRISYPDPNVCIPPFPPDLNCDEVTYKNFKVIGSDPHRFDGDNDGIGCESANGGVEPPSPPPPGGCDRISYPDRDICIPLYPPDLNCPDIPYKNFKVTGSDPHGFDRDNDGIGCESVNRGPPPPPPPPCDPDEPAPGEECVCPPGTTGTPPNCEPEECPPGTTGTPPNCEPICPEGEDCPCPEGTTGTPPNCEPIICDVEDPPPECEEPPIECPDGSTVPPGEECPEPPIDGPCDIEPLPEECEEPPGILPPPENGEEPPEEEPPEEEPPEEVGGQVEEDNPS